MEIRRSFIKLIPINKRPLLPSGDSAVKEMHRNPGWVKGVPQIAELVFEFFDKYLLSSVLNIEYPANITFM